MTQKNGLHYGPEQRKTQKKSSSNQSRSHEQESERSEQVNEKSEKSEQGGASKQVSGASKRTSESPSTYILRGLPSFFVTGEFLQSQYRYKEEVKRTNNLVFLLADFCYKHIR